ncbi:MAG: helix-turn-helix transcriptional regulator [Chitinophagaceae bacterium]|nr:helix-turn-helix transcriptional regulator [Chitinophagaceae bacterium]
MKGFHQKRIILLRNYIHILLLRIREIYRAVCKKMSEAATPFYEDHQPVQTPRVERALLLCGSYRLCKAISHHPKISFRSRKETLVISPWEIINEMLLQSVVLLGSTDKTITEIAYQLCFQDQSHFNHFITAYRNYNSSFSSARFSDFYINFRSPYNGLACYNRQFCVVFIYQTTNKIY